MTRHVLLERRLTDTTVTQVCPACRQASFPDPIHVCVTLTKRFPRLNRIVFAPKRLQSFPKPNHMHVMHECDRICNAFSHSVFSSKRQFFCHQVFAHGHCTFNLKVECGE